MSVKCRECDSSIFWADSKNGKPMPMDSDPDSAGKYVLQEREGENPEAVYDARRLFTEEHRYNCHFDACRAKARK